VRPSISASYLSAFQAHDNQFFAPLNFSTQFVELAEPVAAAGLFIPAVIPSCYSKLSTPKALSRAFHSGLITPNDSFKLFAPTQL
jgi:hypothetical protein